MTGRSGARTRGLPGGKLTSARALKQVPFATMLALNAASKAAKDAATEHLRQHIRAPRPYTLRSVRTERATKAELRARVFVNTDGSSANVPQVRYLRPLEIGGRREAKRSELALRATGMLAPGEFVVPSRGGPLAGNGPRVGGLYRRLIAAAQTSRVRFSKKGTRRLKRTKATVSRIGDLIFEIQPNGERRAMLLVVKAAPNYRRSLDWAGTVERTSREVMPAKWREAMSRALATAR